MVDTILIVDDDEDFIINLQDRIREMQAGYEIETEKEISNTITKITELKNNDKKVVAVFIDIREKKDRDIKDTGLDAISAVKAQFDDIFIVAYTQYGEDYITKAYQCGADWDLRKGKEKDLSLEELKNKIEKHAKEHKLEHTQFKDWNVNMLLKILNGIHSSVARITELKNRNAKSKSIFKIENEYDLQNLMWVVLKPIFPEMIDEDPLQKHMGKSSRVDFYIPEINTYIELKYIETESQAKGIPKQLDNDVTWYSNSSDAKILIFYVLKAHNVTYDFEPMKAKLNQSNFRRDSKTWESVVCIVKPE